MASLPDHNPARWNIREKKAVVKAILDQRLTIPAAQALYDISSEELRSWLRAYLKHGAKALGITKTQVYK